MQQQGHGFKPRKFSLPLVILGLFTAGAATGCDIARRQQAWRLANLLNAQGSSSFTERVKPSAEVICNEPLIVPWSREPCVTYGQTITNLFEMRKKINWERRDETPSELEHHCDFKIRPGASSISFAPAGAEMELETVFNTVDPPQPINSLTSRSLGAILKYILINGRTINCGANFICSQQIYQTWGSRNG